MHAKVETDTQPKLDRGSTRMGRLKTDEKCKQGRGGPYEGGAVRQDRQLAEERQEGDEIEKDADREEADLPLEGPTGLNKLPGKPHPQAEGHERHA